MTEPGEGRDRRVHRSLVRPLQASQAHLRGGRQGLRQRAQRQRPSSPRTMSHLY